VGLADAEPLVCEGCGSEKPLEFHEEGCTEIVFSPERRPSTLPSNFPNAMNRQGGGPSPPTR
jgi:hypothetical protein